MSETPQVFDGSTGVPTPNHECVRCHAEMVIAGRIPRKMSSGAISLVSYRCHECRFENLLQMEDEADEDFKRRGGTVLLGGI